MKNCLITANEALLHGRKEKSYPARVTVAITKRLDQVRSIDKVCLLKTLGKLDETTSQQICTTLVASFT